MYRNKKVSVAISTYQEKQSIKEFIDECFETGFIDEVVVVNNNAEEGTDAEVKKTKARLVYEDKQGYGHGYLRALKETTGDLIIMTEADGTFLTADFEKLLLFSKDYPVVLCTRTNNYAILDGANMGHFLKWGNWAVAKMIEVLFLTTQISDVGCTTRLVHRHVLDNILPRMRVGGSHFGLEMILLVIVRQIPFIEIPIFYQRRIGKSAVTGSVFKAIGLGLVMAFVVIFTRIRSWAK